MAALAKTAITCPGCSEPIELSMRLDENATAGPGELVLAVDRSAVNRHLATVHAEAQGT